VMPGRTPGGRAAFLIAALTAAVLSCVALVRFTLFAILISGNAGVLGPLSIPSGPLPISLTVYGRGEDSLSMGLDFYDPSGTALGSMERSWNGWELTVDAVTVATGTGWLVFPFKAYTDAGGRDKGLDLTRYYNRDGFPALWESSLLSRKERNALRRLFSVVLTERWIPPLFGALHHERLRVRHFMPGVEYTLAIKPDGTLFLLEGGSTSLLFE